MFQKIMDELCKVGDRQGDQLAPEMVPVYLFAVDERSGNYDLSAPLEQLLGELEERGLFSVQADGCLILSLEYGLSEGDIRERLGLVDETGRFRPTLGQWMENLMLQHRVSQGIVLLRVDWSKEQQAEGVWWKRFFRQLHKYRKQFLFLFQVNQSDLNEIEEWLGKEFFCRKVEITRPDAQGYLQHFENGLEKYSLKLLEKDRKFLLSLLQKYEDRLSHQTLEKWLREIVWEYFLEEPKGKKTLSGYLREEALTKHIIGKNMQATIGFKA